jgi:hypothetical protein
MSGTLSREDVLVHAQLLYHKFLKVCDDDLRSSLIPDHTK